MLKGDADRLIEVLQNLLENAIKYGDGKCISIDFSEEEDCRLITVRNSGCSLKQEELINLFDSFYRGSNVGSADGSGLGLYISRQLMQKWMVKYLRKLRKMISARQSLCERHNVHLRIV